MRSIRIIAILLLTITFTAVSLAEDFIVDGIKYSNQDGHTARVEGPENKNCTGKLVIPDKVTYRGTVYNVTSISQFAFSDCKGLTSVEIPGSITLMSTNPFIGCSGLKSIVVQNNTVYDSRDNCNAIIETATNTLLTGCQTTIIPEDIAAIERYAFWHCENLTSIKIPSGVTSISSNAFSGCTGLKTVQWNAKNCSSLYNAWRGCPIETFSFGNDVETIPEHCCHGLSGITSIEIPNSVTSIGSGAFNECSGISSVKLSNSVTTIKGLAFSGCSKITAITIPQSVTRIDRNAFLDCTSLKSVQWDAIQCTLYDSIWGNCPIEIFKIGKDVTRIPDYCCKGISTLTSIEIPENVIKIGNYAFYNCTGLKSVLWDATNCESISNDTWSTCPIDTFFFGNEVETIPQYCCEGLSGITSIEIPNSVTSIGGYAFSGCTGLSSIEIPNSVTSIGGYTFSGCTGFFSIEIPQGVVIIGDYAFSDCTRLRSVQWNATDCEKVFKNPWNNCPIDTFIFSDNIETIPKNCCYGLSNITSIIIPSKVVSIGSSAFEGCTGLKSVQWNATNCESLSSYYTWISCPIDTFIFGNKVETIPQFCCYGLNNITSIEIPQGVVSIGKSAFSDCTGLKSVQWNAINCKEFFYTSWNNCPIKKFNFSKNVEAIPEYCCRGLSGITSIEIPSSVTSIGSYAFSYCTGLASIDIPMDVVSVGEGLFYGCTGLKSVQWNATNCPSVGSSCWNESSVENFYFGKNVEVVPENCCYGLKWLTSIEIPNSVNTIGAYAFSDCDGLVSIEVPLNVTSIGNYAFHLCDNLETLICYAKNPPVCNTNIFMQKTNSVVYVPCESLSTYKNNSIWGQFNLKCISALPEDNVSEVETAPKEKSVIITWPAEDGADLYTIVITNGGVVVCTLKFDSKGELLSIDYPNTSLRGAVLQSYVSTDEGFRFEIKGLDPETEYNYTISTSSGSIIINEESGTFTTLDHTTKVDSIEAGSLQNAVYISGRTITVEGVDDSSVKIFNSLGQIVRNPIQNAGVYVVTVGNETVKVAVP